ncbi:MAG: TolC family protein [bacterium]
MYVGIRPFKILLAGVFFIFFASFLFCGEIYAKNEITKIDIKVTGPSTTINIQFSEKAKYNSNIILENPYRLLIDFTGQKVYSAEADAEINEGLIQGMRLEYQQSNLKAKPVEYIIFTLSSIATSTSKILRKSLIIELNKISTSLDQASSLAASQDIDSIESAIRVGLLNNPQIIIALDEIKLAKLKRLESLRALYPGLKLKYEQTYGDALRENGPPEFEERVYGLELSQSLYYGGKLISTYRQTKYNYEIAKLRYEEILLNAVFDITKAFYEVAKNQKTFQLFKELQKSVAEDIESSRKRYKAKLSTRIEHLNVENQSKQIDYTIASLEKDLKLSKLNLLQLLHLKKETPMSESFEIPFEEIELNLTKSLRMAVLNRPDLIITQKELEVNDLGKVIGRSSNAFKIDLTGFVGKSGGAYENEVLNAGEDYSAGLKVSKPFGGNTVNGSYLFDKTSPKLGQSDRTQSRTYAASLDVLDNIKGYSDELASEIEFKQQQVKLQDIRAEIEKEVRESYYNLEKSFLQVNTTKEEVTLSEEEVIATRSKKNLNLVQISELLSAKLKLANAKKGNLEALNYFNVSLASLNKAVGLKGKFAVDTDIDASDQNENNKGDMKINE